MIVMVKLRLLTFVITGMAIGAVSGPTFTAPKIIFRRPLDVIRDEQVEPTILIVVKPPCAGRPSSFVRDSGLGRNLGERSVAVVVVKNGAPVACHVQIRIAVVVEVADGDALPIVPFTAYTGFLGNISKGAIAVVVIKSAAQRMRRFVNVSCGRLDEEQVHEPVLVIVDPGDPRAHSFQVILLLSLGGILNEGDSCGFANIDIADRNRRILCLGSLCWERTQVGAVEAGDYRQNHAEPAASTEYSFHSTLFGCV